MAMRVSPIRVTHHTTSSPMSFTSGRIVPISRSPYSFFEPTWDVGQWQDFGPIYQRMEEHMRKMNREIDEMFRRFQRLMPLDMYKPNMNMNMNMAALPAPMAPALTGSNTLSVTGPNTLSLTGPNSLSLTAPNALCVTQPPALPEPTWSTAPLIPNLNMPRMPNPPLTMADQWRTENPIVTNKDGSRKVQLEFDVRQFRPDEVTVRTLDNQLTVYARHQEEGPGSHVFREFHRQFILPPSVRLDSLSSVLSPEGVLTVTAPMPPANKALPDPSRERVIPIEYTPK